MNEKFLPRSNNTFIHHTCADNIPYIIHPTLFHPFLLYILNFDTRLNIKSFIIRLDEVFNLIPWLFANSSRTLLKILEILKSYLMKFWKTRSFLFSSFHIYLKGNCIIKFQFRLILRIFILAETRHLRRNRLSKKRFTTKRLGSFKANSSTFLSHDARYYDK